MKFALKILILLLILITPAGAQFENAQKASIKAVAVTSGDTPSGVVIDITVIVTPGDGRVFVSTTPYTEIDMQGSAQLAAITACDLLGVDFTKYSFFYIIEAEAPIVGGPSAGGVMTVATVAALKNLQIREDVYMTGMIYPDGYIGPVGGLKYKLEAAARNGAKIFLIPEGQKITYVEEKKVRRIGIISYIDVEYKKLDLVDYGKKLGVNVYEVSTLNEALRFFTGYEIKNPEGEFNIGSYSQILKKLADRMRASLDEISVTNDEAEKLIKRADEFYNEGKYYTATSMYFQAKILKRYEEYRSKIITSRQFDEEVEKIKSEIDQMKNYLSEKKVGVNSLQIIAAAQERVAEAENLLENARNARTDEEALQNLAYARERVESAKVWLSILHELKNDYEIPKDVLKRRAEFYVTEASSLLVYASTLRGNDYLINEGFISLETAKRLLSEGLYAGAAVVALNSITDASLSIEVTYGNIDDKIEGARKAAMASISEAEKSLFPVLPAAYFEYAENIDNQYLKLMYYKLSMRLAKLLLLIPGGERELVHAEFNPYAYHTPSHEKSTIEKIVETPGFESIAAVIAITFAAALRRR